LAASTLAQLSATSALGVQQFARNL